MLRHCIKAGPNGIEVDVVVVVAEEEKREPGLESVNGDDEQDPHDPALFRGIGVIPGQANIMPEGLMICHVLYGRLRYFRRT